MAPSSPTFHIKAVHPFCETRRQRGLTLLETLVVIAIVGTLAALLFPVFGQINISKMQVLGLNTLKSLQQANLLYAADNDGWSVPVMKNDSEMRRTWWLCFGSASIGKNGLRS
jgi:prepilin-type N-terminal cleavage/methylation domain-containing protein